MILLFGRDEISDSHLAVYPTPAAGIWRRVTTTTSTLYSRAGDRYSRCRAGQGSGVKVGTKQSQSKPERRTVCLSVSVGSILQTSTPPWGGRRARARSFLKSPQPSALALEHMHMHALTSWLRAWMDEQESSRSAESIGYSTVRGYIYQLCELLVLRTGSTPRLGGGSRHLLCIRIGILRKVPNRPKVIRAYLGTM